MAVDGGRIGRKEEVCGRWRGGMRLGRYVGDDEAEIRSRGFSRRKERSGGGWFSVLCSLPGWLAG